jgi:hypothetical protein
MAVDEEIIGQSAGEETEAVLEKYANKFRTFAKDFFDIEINKQRKDPMSKIKEASQLMGYGLPANLNEVFLRPEESHLLWIITSPLNSYLEDYFKMNYSKASGLEHIRSANETFQKWVFNKSASEKKYFANSFLTIAEKKFTNNFWLFLLLASVYLNEKSIMDPGKSVENLVKASEAILGANLADINRNELLYHISILKGFANLKQNNVALANENFTEAIRINPFGITGKFYLALSEIIVNNREIAQHLLNEILNYDIFRCMHAVNTYNAGMLTFFVKYPLSKNVFYYDEFSQLAIPFEEELLTIKNNYFDGYTILKDKLYKLETLKMDEYFSGETLKILKFIAQVVELLGSSKSILYYKVFPDIEGKYNQALNNIKEAVSAKYLGEVKTRLVSLSNKIEDYEKDLELIKFELTEYLQKLKDRYKEAVDRIEKETAAKISEIETIISNLGNVNKLSPRSSFNRAMIYNSVISILVFMMGGCSGYTDSFMYNVYEFRDVLGIILVAGLKWGGVAFFSGILISFFIAGYVIMERANEKQKLFRRISQIKEQKQAELDSLKKDYELSERTINNNFQRRINEKNEDIRLLQEQKDRREKEYTAEAQQKINAELKKLQEVCETKEAADAEKDAA